MHYEFPNQIKDLIDQRMATGRYASQDDVLLQALHVLSDFDGAIADIDDGMKDEMAGRLRPLHEMDSDVRQRLGFTK